MRFLFIIQSEGRGHITQALALRDVLEKQGHQLIKVLAGENVGYPIPASFFELFHCPIVHYKAPHSIIKKGTNRISTSKSAMHMFNKKYIYDSPKTIAKEIDLAEVDIVINFYEYLVAIAQTFFQIQTPVVSVANMFAIEEDLNLVNPEEFSLQFFNHLSRFGANTIVGLCMTPEQSKQDSSCALLPPLLRNTVRKTTVQKKGDFYLVYLKNENLINQFLEKVINFPDTTWHVFVADPKKFSHISKNIIFETIDSERFIALLLKTRGVIGNAGFDLICEAAYFHTPVLTIPINGMSEQQINADHAEKAGISVQAKDCDIAKLLKFEKTYSFDSVGYRKWVNTQDSKWEKVWKRVLGEL